MTSDAPAPLNVHRYGTRGAPPVVLVHGLTDDGTNWPDLVAHWGASWDIVAPDLRGHGRSPRFTSQELLRAPELMREDVAGVLDGLGEPAVLVGHSLGGLLALWGALDRPQAVRALVLEDPTRPRRGRSPVRKFVAMNEDFLDQMSDPVTATAKEAAMHHETAWSEAEIGAWAVSKPLTDRNYVREGFFFDDPQWEAHFNALAVPSLLVIPPDAPMAPNRRRLRNPLVEVAVIPDSGHCVRRDQPALYHAAVDSFLAKLPAL